MIDWDKPIEWFAGKEVVPAVLVCRDENKFIVKRYNDYCAYNVDGTYGGGFPVSVRPPVWIRNAKLSKTMIACLYRWGEDICVINFLHIGAMESFFKHQPGKVLGYKWITVTEGDFVSDNS